MTAKSIVDNRYYMEMTAKSIVDNSRYYIEMTAKSIVDNRYYMGMRVVLRRQSNTIYK
jgi:hypothetical protein